MLATGVSVASGFGQNILLNALAAEAIFQQSEAFREISSAFAPLAMMTLPDRSVTSLSITPE